MGCRKLNVLRPLNYNKSRLNTLHKECKVINFPILKSDNLFRKSLTVIANNYLIWVFVVLLVFGFTAVHFSETDGSHKLVWETVYSAIRQRNF